MQKVSIKLLVGVSILLSNARGATFTGFLKTKHDRVIAYCNLRAISNAGEIREFSTTRNGSFSVELVDGLWSILADTDQINAWGFSQMENVSITINENTNVVKNLILFASEPLQKPSLTFTRPNPRTWNFIVKGQGGTVVKIFSSRDLKTWTFYNAVALGTTGYEFGSSASSYEYIPRMYFRACATTE